MKRSLGNLSALGALAALWIWGVGCTARYTPLDTLISMPPAAPAPTPESKSPARAIPTPPEPLTLERAIGRSLAQNPGLLAEQERLFAADAARVQAHARENPTVSAEIEGFDGDRSAWDRSEITLSLGIPLDVFGERGVRIDVARADLAAARAGYHGKRWELAGRTRFAFHAVLAGEERLGIAEARLRVTEETALAIGRQVEAGKARPLEKIRAEVANETVRSEVQSARTRLHAARRELGAMWGGSEMDVADLRGELRTSYPGVDRDALVSELFERHPILQEQLWNAESKKRAVRLVGRARWPQVSPEVGVRWLREDNARDLVAGLSISLPVLDRKGGSLREAKRQHDAAIIDARNTRLSLETELDLGLRELEETQNRLDAYTVEILPRARESLELARSGYERGKFGYLDLLDAQKTWIDVESGLAEAVIAFDRALVRLEVLLGRRLE